MRSNRGDPETVAEVRQRRRLRLIFVGAVAFVALVVSFAVYTVHYVAADHASGHRVQYTTSFARRLGAVGTRCPTPNETRYLKPVLADWSYFARYPVTTDQQAATLINDCLASTLPYAANLWSDPSAEASATGHDWTRIPEHDPDHVMAPKGRGLQVLELFGEPLDQPIRFRTFDVYRSATTGIVSEVDVWITGYGVVGVG